MKRERLGFSLIELSMVLIIVGLIVGAIVGAFRMIEVSRIQKTTKDIQRYLKAVQQFGLIYQAQPGDFDNATNIWSGTANGDGDELIEAGNEQFRAWQHLYLAEIISDYYPGTHTSNVCVSATNCPPSAFKNSVFSFQNDASIDFNSAAGGAMSVTDQTFLWLGKQDNSHGTSALLSPQQAHVIDKKIDDGLPDSGFMFSTQGSDSQGQCVQGDSSARTYLLSTDSARCIFQIKLLEKAY